MILLRLVAACGIVTGFGDTPPREEFEIDYAESWCVWMESCASEWESIDECMERVIDDFAVCTYHVEHAEQCLSLMEDLAGRSCESGYEYFLIAYEDCREAIDCPRGA